MSMRALGIAAIFAVSMFCISCGKSDKPQADKKQNATTVGKQAAKPPANKQSGKQAGKPPADKQGGKPLLNKQGEKPPVDPPMKPPVKPPSQSADPGADRELAIAQRFSGVCTVPVSFGPPPAGDQAGERLVVRNADAWQGLLDTIPRDAVSKTNPPPKNDDPILTATIDWDKHMVIYVSRPGSLSAPPKIESVEVKDGAIHARYSLPEASVDAFPEGYGSYEAVVVPHTPGEMKFAQAD